MRERKRGEREREIIPVLTDQEVKDVRKTKENFRSTIRKLREQNTSLEAKMSELTQENESLTSAEVQRRGEFEQQHVKMTEMEQEREHLLHQTQQLEKRLAVFEDEITSLSAKLKQAEALHQRMKRELEESVWERDQLQQRLSNVSQREQKLAAQQTKLLQEIELISKELKQKVPVDVMIVHDCVTACE